SNLSFAPGSQIAGTRTLSDGGNVQLDGNLSFDTLQLGNNSIVTGAGAITLTGNASGWSEADVHVPVTIAAGGDLHFTGFFGNIGGNVTVSHGGSLHLAGD